MNSVLQWAAYLEKNLQICSPLPSFAARLQILEPGWIQTGLQNPVLQPGWTCSKKSLEFEFGSRRGEHLPMALEAWYMKENDEDKSYPNHKNPKEFVSLSKLAEIGILYWHLNAKNYENDEELKEIRETRGYNYMDILDLCPEKVENYEQKLKNFYTEHIHADEEIRYCLEGSGYFDVRDKDDRWIRIWIKEGDLIILPAGIYHRFTLDTSNYVKLMRLFKGEPVWTAYNRPQENHPARQGYIKNVVENSGIALEAH